MTHLPQPHELRRAHRAAQTLAETLELAGMDFEAQVARDIRQRCWERLLELAGQPVQEPAAASQAVGAAR